MTKFNIATLILTAILLMTSINYCYAGAALKITPMQSSITGVIATKAKQRGFAANDPRFTATVNAISGNVSNLVGGVAGATASAVVLGAVTAPAWGTIAIAAGVGAVVTIGVALAVNSLISWAFSSDPNDPLPITQTTQSQSQNLVQGGGFFYWGNKQSADYYPLAWLMFNNGYGFDSRYSLGNCTVNGGASCDVIYKNANGSNSVSHNAININYQAQGAQITCGSGQLNEAGVCTAITSPPQPAQSTPLTPQQALDNLSAAEKAKPLNPAILAAVADKLWQDAAAEPDYGGLPYKATDPITTNDAKTYQDANPTTYPTVGDFVNPQIMADSPFTLPVSPDATTQDVTNPNTGINPAAANPLTNLGTDPVIGNPSLEETPTALSILQPLFNMFPDFKTFAVPSHSSVCPTPTFNLFGESIVMDAQCKIANDQRPALYAIMAVVWLLAGAIIVLRA